MLKRLFSERGRYRRYAACCAALSFGYLLAGFIIAKLVFTGETILPGWKSLGGITIGAAVFALMHVNSMRGLDRAHRKPRGD